MLTVDRLPYGSSSRRSVGGLSDVLFMPSVDDRFFSLNDLKDLKANMNKLIQFERERDVFETQLRLIIISIQLRFGGRENKHFYKEKRENRIIQVQFIMFRVIN